MRASDLDHDGLLELDPAGGIIRFASQRAILLDAMAMGLLRKHLVDGFGEAAARTVFTQFGFAHGWRMATAMRETFQWDNDSEWQAAGMRIHALGGLFQVGPGGLSLLAKEGVVLAASYEAEQHLLHFGREDAPTCWTICGFASGYISRTLGREIFVFEDRCLGKGDAACHLFGRPRDELGPDRAAEVRFFEASRLKDCLDVSLSDVIETLKQAEQRLRERRSALVRVAPEVDDPLGLVARSDCMRTLIDVARRVAKVDSTVLITGKSGSGKERIARLVHAESSRAAGPFIAINCGAIAETLLESELFGHARGSFTGATHDRVGLFEAAHGGTLLLDEVGEIPANVQVKLLRVLQEREIRRVGENKSRHVDVRILAATNRDLLQAVTAGRFREDLYYRLKVVELQVPALRERRDDILPLARILLAEAGLRLKREPLQLAPSAAEALLRHDWPGNVRELANTMERATALTLGPRVEREDLPAELLAPRAANEESGLAAIRPLEAIARAHILAVLDLNQGNQALTAKQLGIGSATLFRKLRKYRSAPVASDTEPSAEASAPALRPV